MSQVKKFNKTLSKRLPPKAKCSRSDALNVIIKELRRSGNLVSCVLTDNNGFIIAEAAHPRDDRENLSALVAFIDNAGDQQNIGVAHGSDQFYAESLHIIVRRQQIQNFNVAVVARRGADVKHPN